MAVYYCHLCGPRYPNDRGAPARVSFLSLPEIKASRLRAPAPPFCPCRKDKIAWECDNGGQLWTDSVTAGYDNGSSFPSGFCTTGFASLNIAFIISLLVDLVFQVRDIPLPPTSRGWAWILRIIAPAGTDSVCFFGPGLHVLPDLEVFEALGALPEHERTFLRR